MIMTRLGPHTLLVVCETSDELEEQENLIPAANDLLKSCKLAHTLLDSLEKQYKFKSETTSVIKNVITKAGGK